MQAAAEARFLLESAGALAATHGDPGGGGTAASEAAVDVAVHLGRRLLALRERERGASSAAKLRAAAARGAGAGAPATASVRGAYGRAHEGGVAALGIKAFEWRQLCEACGLPDADGGGRRVRLSTTPGRRGRRRKGRRWMCVKTVCAFCGHRAASRTGARPADGERHAAAGRAGTGGVTKNAVLRSLIAEDSARRLLQGGGGEGGGAGAGHVGVKKRKRNRNTAGVSVDASGRRSLT